MRTGPGEHGGRKFDSSTGWREKPARMLRNTLVASSLGLAIVLLATAFASDPPPVRLGLAQPLSETIEPELEAPGPSTRVRASAFAPAVPAPSRVLTEADLAPALKREPVCKAKALFDAGRFSDALAVFPPGEAKALPERFLRALLLSRADRHAEAAAAFNALSGEYPVLADRCRFLAAMAFDRAGDLAAATSAYAAIDSKSVFYAEARLALGDVLRRRGDLKAAAAVLAPWAAKPAPPGWDIPAEALFELASVQEAQGSREQAAASFLKLWSEHAGSRHGERARERAEALNAKPTAAHVILHAEGLMNAHHNAQAVSALLPIVETPPKNLPSAALCRARFILGKSYRKLHQHAKALAVFDSLIRQCRSEPELWARGLYVAGTSASFVDPEAAIRYYGILAGEVPDSSLADDALLDEAELLARAGKPAQARVALRRLIAMYPDGDNRSEALFQLFWIERSQGHPERGMASLERLARDYATSDPSSTERALYWRARSLVALGKIDAGVLGYEDLVARHPASFYTLLARSRLSEIAPDRVAPIVARLAVSAPPAPGLSLPLGTLDNDRHAAAAVELLKMGMPEAARDELLSVERSRLHETDSLDALRALVTLLSRAGETRLAHGIARMELHRDLSGTLDAENAVVWRVAYPLAFRAAIEQRAQEAGVDPDLLQALIREESALDPKVHSWAGAVGLCQLMMPTAREVARWLKLQGPITADRLHDPETNVHLGATYLGFLIKQFRGNLALSLASYNAGGAAVTGWIQQAGARDLDEFIEEIPVSETRNYVKRVLKTYAAYQYVYGRGARGTTLGQALVAHK